MATDLSNIHFQDARIIRVIEDVDRRSLTFEVSYPIPEGGSDFPGGKLIFEWYSQYLVAEGDRSGESVIQRVEVIKAEPHRQTIRIHTDRGFREMRCYRVVEERI